MLKVELNDAPEQYFDAAVAFEIDEGVLILLNAQDGPVAAFAPGVWLAVQT